MMTTDTLILGDCNAQHSSWYSSSTDSRGTMLESMVSGSNFGIINWDSPTRLPGNANPSSPDVSLSSASLITSTNWQMKTNLGSDHLPILISLRKSLTSAATFTIDQFTKGIRSCSNTRAFGPDKLSIFHLKHLVSRGIEYLTALFDYSVTSCPIPSICNSSIVIPIPKPGKDSSLSTSYRPISLLCPAAKVMEALLLPTVNNHLLLSADQHGFSTRTLYHFCFATTQLTSDIATGFDQRKLHIRYSQPHRIVIKDCKINTARGDLSMAIKLDNQLQAAEVSSIVHTVVP